jgi:hypothetical protein
MAETLKGLLHVLFLESYLSSNHKGLRALGIQRQDFFHQDSCLQDFSLPDIEVSKTRLEQGMLGGLLKGLKQLLFGLGEFSLSPEILGSLPLDPAKLAQ